MTAEAQVYVQPWARVSWPTPETPRSEEYGDIYWSRDQALAEKQHVFVRGNDLPARWAQIDGGQFTLCETGFGFGINCLLATNLWRRQNPRNAILNYVAFEKFPVSPGDLSRLLNVITPEPGIDADVWQRHAARLQDHYPLPSPGDHLIWLDDDICLRLVIGDINQTLPGNISQADAWYLDGFSPSQNADAWQPSLFRQMANASRPGATFATYSVAGDVRRGLDAAGFGLVREAGYGRKAEMLRGALPGQWQPRRLDRSPVGIIGAGLAGLHCTLALARRGIPTTCFEQAESPLSAASCVPRLAVSPRLSVRPDNNSLFSLAAFHYAMQSGQVVRSGYCRYAPRTRDNARFERIAEQFPEDFCALLSPSEASELTGVALDARALWMPAGGWTDPGKSLTELPPGCTLETSTRVLDLQADEDGVRIILADGGIREFASVVIATGMSIPDPLSRLFVTPMRGQSIMARLTGKRIDKVIGGAVSVVPVGDNQVIAGSTYENGVHDDSIRDSDTRRLLHRLETMTGAAAEVTGAYAGIRCTTRDRMPITGRMPHHIAPDETRPVYVCTGFGSHGATLAPLCAEQLARRISGEPNAFNEGWAASLDAARPAVSPPR